MNPTGHISTYPHERWGYPHSYQPRTFCGRPAPRAVLAGRERRTLCRSCVRAFRAHFKRQQQSAAK